jgi:hypothetical protein
MSLDIYLTLDEAAIVHSGIFVRDGGRTVEMSRDEWNEKFPDREPVTIPVTEDSVFGLNITHNLVRMADEVGIYQCLWRPEEIGITRASELVDHLRNGLALLKSDPERFREFNPANGWGNYETLVVFVETYLAACEAYPDAKVSVWR